MELNNWYQSFVARNSERRRLCVSDIDELNSKAKLNAAGYYMQQINAFVNTSSAQYPKTVLKQRHEEFKLRSILQV